MSPVLQSAEWIAARSRHVSIPSAGVDNAAKFIAEKMNDLQYSRKTWRQHELNPKQDFGDGNTIAWIFLCDLLNFSFWSEHQEPAKVFGVEYRGRVWTGYWSLCAAINRAIDDGVPITDPAYFARMDRKAAEHIFRPQNEEREEIPLLDERVRVLNEAGRVLLEKYDGKFENCIKQCNRSAEQLLNLITTDFPCFNDHGVFDGRIVYFHKRAQILIADLWACFDGVGWGEFIDIDCITMFADYRVPQALCGIGALVYDDELMRELNEESTRLAYGSRAEQEIRGCSIWAVEENSRAPWGAIKGFECNYY